MSKDTVTMSREAWEAHQAFHRLTVQQRDMAWRENDDLRADKKLTCRICDKNVGIRTYTFANGRVVHRDCFENLCLLMPHWIPDLPKTKGAG